MLTEFLTFVNDHALLTPATPTLLAVSGGLDSVVLAELFHRANLPFGIAHAHFGLRGAESDADAVFVQTLAEQYRVPFFTKRFDTTEYAETYGISTQMAARRQRYAWLEQLRTEQQFGTIATAHHRTDSLETALLNLTRGTGLAGLRGIPVRNGAVIRPLLFTDRPALEAFARAEGLTWREDSSNATDAYARNRIRHHVVPVLRQLNPSLDGTFAATSERLAAAERLLRAEFDRLREGVLSTRDGVTVLALPPLLAHAEAAFALIELLRPFGFEYALARRIFDALPGQPGRRFESTTHTLTIDRAQLWLAPRQTNQEEEERHLELGTTEVPLPGATLRISCHARTGFEVPADPAVACLDASTLAFPLTLRRWRPGDWFEPLGLGGHRKKVSDFLIDRKVPRPLKDRVRVLVSGETIAWVVGMRVDERYRITDATHRILRLEVCADWE
jgi:tRNA(Ile)-lysidine synthase